jgi:hypothetical protein
MQKKRPKNSLRSGKNGPALTSFGGIGHTFRVAGVVIVVFALNGLYGIFVGRRMSILNLM